MSIGTTAWDEQVRAIGILVLTVMQRTSRLRLVREGDAYFLDARHDNGRVRAHSEQGLADALERLVKHDAWRTSSTETED